MRESLKPHNITYSGVDWTAHFVQHAQKEFPENPWLQGDGVRGISVEPADVDSRSKADNPPDRADA
jgi:hypothetical protein